MKTICGIDCAGCGWKENCKGCAETKGSPFGGRWNALRHSGCHEAMTQSRRIGEYDECFDT